MFSSPLSFNGPALGSLLLVVTALPCLPGSAWALETGVAVGVGVPLHPQQEPGISAGISTVLTPVGASQFLRVRGEILGLLTSDCQAALPTLTGDMGGRWGPVDLAFSGGVELFGLAFRDRYTLFSTIGFTAGLTGGWQLTPDLRLALRSMVTWLPDPTTAILESPQDGTKPLILFLSGLLVLEWRMADSPTSFDEL